MSSIKHKMFKGEQFDDMMYFLNSIEAIGNIISITQAKNNDFNIFYWGNK